MRLIILLIPIVLYLLMVVRRGSGRRRLIWFLPPVILGVLLALLLVMTSTLSGGGMVSVIYGSAIVFFFTGPIVAVYLLILILLSQKVGQYLSGCVSRRIGSNFSHLPGPDGLWFLLTIILCFFVVKFVWDLLLCLTSGGYAVSAFKMVPVANWTGCFKFIKIF